MSESNQSIIDECMERLRIAIDAESTNRQNAVDDIKFSLNIEGNEQWDDAAIRSRGLNRPMLTINHTDTFVRRVCNNLRQQRPRIKVHPINDGADLKTAEVIQGLIRHIENNSSSSADLAYDTGAECAVRGGWGYWRVCTKYVEDRSFDQEIYLDEISNQFTVYMDPAAISPDGSDAQWVVVTDMMKIDDARGQGYDSGIELAGLGDAPAEWVSRNGSQITHVRIAEYFRIVQKPETLYQMSDGSTRFASDLPSAESMQASGYQIATDKDGKQISRSSFKRKVEWFKLNCAKVLEKKEWAGKYIPVVRCEGRRLNIEGKIMRQGMVRQLKDPARMYNYWRTTETERYALAPKAPWLMAEGQAEGYEQEWDSANQATYSRLTYKPVTGTNGELLPPPQRQAPVPIESGMATAAQGAEHDLLAVAGMSQEPGMDKQGEVISGRAIRQRQAMSDISHFDFYDNQTRSICFTGCILLDLIPKIYDTQRMIRIIGEDGLPQSAVLNEKQIDPVTQGVIKVKNDITVGYYDVVMDTGPGYQTKRQEGSETLLGLLSTELGKKIAAVADDVVVRQLDVNGASDIADRLAAANPMSQIDKQSDVPPQAQMLIKSLQQQLDQMQKHAMALELELKTKQGIEHGWMAVEREKAGLKAKTDDANSKRDFEGWMHEVEVNSVTKRDVAEIQVAGSLLNTHVEAEHDKQAAKALINKGVKTETVQ